MVLCSVSWTDWQAPASTAFGCRPVLFLTGILFSKVPHRA